MTIRGRLRRRDRESWPPQAGTGQPGRQAKTSGSDQLPALAGPRERTIASPSRTWVPPAGSWGSRRSRRRAGPAPPAPLPWPGPRSRPSRRYPSRPQARRRTAVGADHDPGQLQAALRRLPEQVVGHAARHGQVQQLPAVEAAAATPRGGRAVHHHGVRPGRAERRHGTVNVPDLDLETHSLTSPPHIMSKSRPRAAASDRARHRDLGEPRTRRKRLALTGGREPAPFVEDPGRLEPAPVA